MKKEQLIKFYYKNLLFLRTALEIATSLIFILKIEIKLEEKNTRNKYTENQNKK